MSLRFDTTISPFNVLPATEQMRLCEQALHVTLLAGARLWAPGSAPGYLWVLRSGHVQVQEDGHVHVLSTGEATSWRAVLTPGAAVDAHCLDEVHAWQLPSAVVLEVLGANMAFGAWVYALLAAQMHGDADLAHTREMTGLMLTHARDAYLQPAFFVDGSLDLVSVCRLLAEQQLTHALVRDNVAGQSRLGMFSTTDLRDALLQATAPNQLPVRDVARFNLVSLDADATLFDALLSMLQHQIHRVVVHDGESILGLLSQLDLMSFMSNHSQLITLQMEHAHNVESLQSAALQVEDTVKMMQRAGMRVELISQLVSALNSQLFARLWALVAPPDLVQNSCLLVMGSEGRGEQILKTDQDNALLLREGYNHPDLAAITEQFSQTLLQFGYPPCPGQIMVTNPLWRQNVGAFRQVITRWIYGGEPDGKMNLSIFMDARAVAGDASLLDEARSHLMGLASGEASFLAHLASAIEQFQEPNQSWWSRLPMLGHKDTETFDLKKLGTFPIVHGVRALTLEYRIAELGTVERLQQLVKLHRFPADLARDLTETLHMLMALKLRNNLRQRAMGQAIGNEVELASLGALDRDQLREALTIIRQFKQYLRVHYRLAA